MACFVLNRLGIAASKYGYRYIECAIELVRENRDLLLAVTTRLYPSVAAHFHVSPSSVEHNIRYCLEHCWNTGDRNLFNEIAGYPLQYRPYTREFIAMLADYQQNGINMQADCGAEK